MHTKAPFLAPFVLTLAACAPATTPRNAAGDRAAVVFPTVADLAAVPAKSPGETAFRKPTETVDHWTMEAAPAPVDETSPWVQALRKALAGKPNVRLTSAMECAAKDVAAFNAKQATLPDDLFQHFAVARCGGFVAHSQATMFWVEVPPRMSDERVAAEIAETFATRFAQSIPADGPYLSGVAMVREGKRVAVAALFAKEEAVLAPGFQAVGEGRTVKLRGAAKGALSRVVAFVNRGEAGVAPCEVDPAVRAPAFAITCTMAKGDDHAWIGVAGLQEGRVLLKPLGDALAFAGATPTEYRGAAPGPNSSAAAPGSPELQKEILVAVNGHRARAHLAPLTLAPDQSAEVQRIAGTFVEAHAQDDAKLLDTMSLGMLAGWRVSGTIREADIFYAQVVPARSAEQWVTSNVTLPLGRVVFMKPEARQLAVGTVAPPSGNALGVVATTYGFYESDDHAADEQKLIDRITKMRGDAPGPVRLLKGGTEAEKALARVRAGDPPSVVLDDLLRDLRDRENASVAGWVTEGIDPSAMQLPNELMDRRGYDLLVAVTHRRAAGAAWGQLAAFIVALPRR